MWHNLFRIVQRYSPWMMLPLTIPLGYIGFKLEEKYRTPQGIQRPTNTIEDRYERQLKSIVEESNRTNNRDSYNGSS
jgi:hypothetical protein